jgi:hypothetical protein
MNPQIDTNNPAVSRQLQVPPKLLEDVAADPAKYEPVVRSMAVVHMDQLYRRMMQPDVPLATRLDFQKLLNKMARLEPEAKAVAQAGTGFVFNINLGGGRQMHIEGEQLAAIEGELVEVLDAD